jgi:hypothetical protein
MRKLIAFTAVLFAIAEPEPALANPKIAAETYCAFLTAGGSVNNAEKASKEILINYRLQSTTSGMSGKWLDTISAAFAMKDDLPATKAFIYINCGELHMEKNLYERNGEYRKMREQYNELLKIEPKTLEQKAELDALDLKMKELRDKKKAKDMGG